MTYKETIEKLRSYAIEDKIINKVIETENVFDVSKDNYEMKFPVFVITPLESMTYDLYNAYSLRLWYIDRLTLDKKNSIEVQSDGLDICLGILLQAEKDDIELSMDAFFTFTIRFSEECAGAYADVTIYTPHPNKCAEEYDVI